jgi:4-hydroxy-4-methyl-2-oxoglutarate aldolase
MSARATLLERAIAIPTAILSDVRDGVGVIDPQIRPLERQMQLSGRARTAACAKGDVLASLRTLLEGGPGEVLVVGGLDSPLACLGAFMTKTCVERGMVGAVLDGYVRDLEEIVTEGFPVFARGATPRIATAGDAGTSQVPISCGGVEVRPGDLIRGDADGVIVIPWQGVDSVLERAEALLEQEAAALARMESGEGIEALYGDYMPARSDS